MTRLSKGSKTAPFPVVRRNTGSDGLTCEGSERRPFEPSAWLRSVSSRLLCVTDMEYYNIWNAGKRRSTPTRLTQSACWNVLLFLVVLVLLFKHKFVSVSVSSCYHWRLLKSCNLWEPDDDREQFRNLFFIVSLLCRNSWAINDCQRSSMVKPLDLKPRTVMLSFDCCSAARLSMQIIMLVPDTLSVFRAVKWNGKLNRCESFSSWLNIVKTKCKNVTFWHETYSYCHLLHKRGIAGILCSASLCDVS